VTGFVLSAEDLPTVYISGDNASLDVVRVVRERAGRIDVALLFAGAARLPVLDRAPLTLTAADAVVAVQVLDAAVVVPLHVDGWSHFTEDVAELQRAFDAAGLAERLHVQGLRRAAS
jgi:L-ascorbate metabolism protein UlaG (beta-lactamase superfamily)